MLFAFLPVSYSINDCAVKSQMAGVQRNMGW